MEWYKEKIHAFLTRKMAVVLVYHSVIDKSLPFDLWTHLSLKKFVKQMGFLSRHCNVVSLVELSNYIDRGEIPRNTVVITFDDGFANNYHQAYPVLKSLGLPATFFLTTDHIDSGNLLWPEYLVYLLVHTTVKDLFFDGFSFSLQSDQLRGKAYVAIRDYFKTLHPYKIESKLAELSSLLRVQLNRNDWLYKEFMPLNWQQVQEMEKDGVVSFGGHTATHTILSRLSDKEASEQIFLCRKALDAHLGTRSGLWAYPNGEYGDFNNIHQKMLIDANFEVIATTIPDHVTFDSNIHELGRLGIGSGITMKDFRSLIFKRNWLDGLSNKNKMLKALQNL